MKTLLTLISLILCSQSNADSWHLCFDKGMVLNLYVDALGNTNANLMFGKYQFIGDIKKETSLYHKDGSFKGRIIPSKNYKSVAVNGFLVFKESYPVNAILPCTTMELQKINP